MGIGDMEVEVEEDSIYDSFLHSVADFEHPEWSSDKVSGGQETTLVRRTNLFIIAGQWQPSDAAAAPAESMAGAVFAVESECTEISHRLGFVCCSSGRVAGGGVGERGRCFVNKC